MPGNITNASGATLIELHLANNTEADLTSNILTLQLGFCTDTYRLLTKSAGSNIYRAPMLDSSDHLALPLRVVHEGDTNTYFDFTTDRWTLTCGGIQMIDCVNTTQDIIKLNGGGSSADVDLQMFDSAGGTLLYADAGTKYVGIGTATPRAKLEIAFTSPAVYFYETDASADNTLWSLEVAGEAFYGQVINDANNAATPWLTVNRTANTIDNVLFPNGLVGVGITPPVSRLQSASAVSALTSVAGFNSLPLTVTDTTALAIDTGGGISFSAICTAGGAYNPIAAIKSGRTVATTNDYRGYLAFYTGRNSTGYPIEHARLDTSGNLLLNCTAARLVGPSTAIFEIEGVGGDDSSLSIIRNSADSGGSYMILGKTRSATVGGVTKPNSGDDIGSLVFAIGNDTNAGGIAAQIMAQVDAGPGASDYPGRLTFWTTADGAAAPTERMRIDSAGYVLHGLTTSTTISGGGPAWTQMYLTASVIRDTNDNGAPYFIFGKNRGSATTIVQNNDELGRMTWAASDGTDMVTEAAMITASVDGTPGANDMPGRLSFWTTADGAATPTERMRIDNSGYILCGLTASTLTGGVGGTVQTATAMSVLRASNNTSPGYFVFGKNRGSATTIVQDGDEIGRIMFAVSDGTDMASYSAYISAAVDGTPGADDTPGRLTFHTTADGAATSTERMRITSAGLVGVGTTTPDIWTAGLIRQFTVGTDNAAASASIAVYGGTTGTARIDMGNATILRAGVYALSGSALTFLTNASDSGTTLTERMRITSSGQLLIGCTASRNSGTATPQIQMEGTSIDSSSMALVANVNSAYGARLHFSKTRAATIGGTTAATTGDNLGSIIWCAADGTDITNVSAQIQGFIEGTVSADTTPGRLVFSTTAAGAGTVTERMRIDSAGLVGIATTSPLHNLHVKHSSGAATMYDALFEDDSGNGLDVILASVANGRSRLWFGDNTTDPGGDSDCAYIAYRVSTHLMQIGVGSTYNNYLTIDTTSGIIGIGCTPSGTLLDMNLVSQDIAGIYIREGDSFANGVSNVYPESVWFAVDTPTRGTASGTGGAIVTGVTSGSSIPGLQLRGVIGAADPADTLPALGLIGAKSDGSNNLAALGSAETVFQLLNHTTALITVLGSGNVGIGTTTFGSSAATVLAIANGTAPSAHVDNEIQIYSVDSSDAAATLGLMLEQAVEDIGTFTASHKIKVKINGTEYWLQLDAV